MKSYKDITDRYLKHNKKRTLLTILGVVLSVALITSVALFIKSMQNSYVSQAIKSNGSYHVQISNADKGTYDEVKNNPKVDKIGFMEQKDKVALSSSKTLKITECDKNGYSLLPYGVSKGRLPEREGEIALESWITSYMQNSPKIGDTVEIKFTNGEAKNYKVTGYLQNNSSNQYLGEGQGLIYTENFDFGREELYLTIKESAGIKNTVSELSKKYKNVTSNQELLRYLGQSDNNQINNSLYSVAAVIIGIIVIATVAVIYNSFQISVVERIKQFGLLRAVGATPKQIRKIVLREAFIISMLGIPLGLVSGILAVEIVIMIFRMLTTTEFGSLQLVIPYYIILISAAVGLFSIYMSALIPAKFAAKVSPLEAISSRNSIAKEKISKKRGKIAKRFLGISSLMAFKNIKRNRKRFNVTVFSTAISVMLFIFFSSFMKMVNVFNQPTTESDKAQFAAVGVVNKDGKSSLTYDILNQIKSNQYVKDVFVSYGNYSSKILISEEQKDKDAVSTDTKIYNSENYDGKSMVSLNTDIDIYGKEKLKVSKSYVKSGSIDTSNMADENGIILVKNARVAGKKGSFIGPMTNLKVGDSFYINKNIIYNDSLSNSTNTQQNVKYTFDKNNVIKLKVAAVVDDAPFSGGGSVTNFNIIVPDSVIKNIMNKSVEKLPLAHVEMTLKDKKDSSKFEKWLREIGDKNGIKIINVLEEGKNQQNGLLQISILMYGFIVVISLIGIVNIINTMTTNIILRRKEIASLNALGMTFKDIRTMIYTEGILYGLYGALYGSIFGSLLSYLINSSMQKVMGFKWSIPVNYIIIAAVASIAVGIISVIKPINKIKAQNTVEVIRAE